MNCKKQEFKDKCKEACGYCPPSGAATVVTTVTAFGSIADYPEVHQGEIKQNFATAANVDASVVDIDVQSGSVIITFTIPVTTQEAALALRTMLFAKIGTAAQATAVLGADIYEDPTFDMMIGSPSQPSDAATTANLLTASSEADGSGSTMALIGGVVAAVGLLALLLLASRCVPPHPLCVSPFARQPTPLPPQQPPTADAASGTEQGFDPGLRPLRRRQSVWVGRQRAVDRGGPEPAHYRIHLGCQRLSWQGRAARQLGPPALGTLVVPPRPRAAARCT